MMSPKLEETIRVCLIFLVALVAFSYFNRDNNRRDHSVESRMALVKALVDERRFEIDSFHNSLFSTSDKAYYDGHYYSDKAIGISLLGAIVYKSILWVAGLTGWELPFRYFRDMITIFTISWLAAWIAPLLYLLIRRISPDTSAGQSAFLALATTLGTPYFKFSTFFYGHAIAGLFLLAAFYIWFTYHQTGSISLPRVFLSGFLLGWMIITEYPTILLAAAAGIYILIVLWKMQSLTDWRVYLLVAAGAILPLGALLFYNYAAFGGIFTLGYTHEAAEKFHTAHNTGLFGVGLPNPAAIFYMTFHHTMGIFWQSPILLLALPGWYYLFRSGKFRPEAWFTLLTVCLYIVFMSGYYMWWGYAFTPRHLIPVLPLFVLPLASLPKKYFPILIITGVISIIQMLIVAAANSDGLPELLIPAFETGVLTNPGSIIYGIYLPNLLNGLFVHNLGETLFHLEGFAIFLPFIAIQAVLIIALVILTVKPHKLTDIAHHESVPVNQP
jgi:hypothetical protein